MAPADDMDRPEVEDEADNGDWSDLGDGGDWTDLGHPSGLTMIQVANLYQRPLREVREAFVWGREPDWTTGAKPKGAGIGKANEHQVWFAKRRDVERRFGRPNVEVTMAHAASRAANKLAELRAKLDEEGEGDDR